MINPLLTSFILPPFSKIKTEHIVPAVNRALTNCYLAIECVANRGAPYTWENIAQPLAETDDNLERILSPICHLHSVKNTPELRKSYEQILPLITEYYIWTSQHEGLYKAYCALYNSAQYAEFSIPQRKTINNILRNFKLSGIELSKEKQKRYREISIQLSTLSDEYNNNVLDATLSWTKLITDKSQLDGIPQDLLTTAECLAKEKGRKGWLLTLDASNYSLIMTYCNDQSIREEIYKAYITRASDQGSDAGKWDNTQLMNEIIVLRHELAQLLGFDNYFYKSLATDKMAKTPKQVLDFLKNLVKRTRPQGEKELAQLFTFTREKYGVNKLQPWDITWYSEKQKQYLYNIKDEQIRSYFPEHKVINGLFEVAKHIYGLSVKERYDVDIWSPEVRFFEIYDDTNEMRGSFYLDLYTRDNKFDGAWMDTCIKQMRKADGSLQKPVAYLTCNFNRSTTNKPILLTHNEVINLFHEFGHCLHHILTRIEIADVTGINGVPWDVIELPSQFMEHWCWEPEVLTLISGHYETNDPLPKNIINKILSAKNYQAAIFMLHQLELGLFDFRLHTEFNPEQGAKILETFIDVKKQVSVISTPEWNRSPHTFSHIFAGNYAAGYYSYLWADVLASDAYSRFREEGVFNRTTGQSFLDNILAHGGSEEPIDMFKRFRGREPKVEAMLENYGIEG